MRALLRAACLVLVSSILVGCGPRPDASYRYKLTISVETPEGLKTGSNVVELDFFKSWSGEPHRTYGQALVLDLGASGMLVALLSQQKEEAWEQDDPKYMILKKCGGDERNILGPIDIAQRISACKSAYPLALSELPDILLLKNAKDPASASVVDPGNPGDVLGSNVVIRAATIQVTQEPLTHGVDEHLPVLRNWWGHIDSPLLHTHRRIFNSITPVDFIAEGQG
jgi:hypothetical protein